MTQVTWTPQREERVKELWNKGHSAAEIARDLGGITRNTVIGKIHRMGLRREEKTSAIPAQAPPPKPTIEAAPEKRNERNFWTREEEDLLLELRAAGKPFPVITAELNKQFPNRDKPFYVVPLTAKYYYLLKQGRAPKSSSGRAAKVVVSRAAIKATDFTQIFTTEADGERAQRVKALEAASRQRSGKRLGILDLTQQTCHWPIGDPDAADFHFCGLQAGGPRRNGKPSPYCVAHTELAYQPASEYRPRQRRS